jgi:subtilisin family serine protease
MKSSLTRPLVLLFVLVFAACAAAPAAAEQRFIVRTQPSITTLFGTVTPAQIIRMACAVAGCTVRYGLDDEPSQLFLVTAPDNASPLTFTALLPILPGIQHVEPDLVLRTLSGGDATGAPPALLDTEPATFFGATVPGGYLRQPANAILGISAARDQYGLTGQGITVAVIDTGVDPTHPVLNGVVLDGYDFTRNQAHGSEKGDVDDSVMYTVDQARPGYVNDSTIAVLDESAIAALHDSRYRAFGHGTMVAGLVHLVAPRAAIMPLKAFGPDGNGYTSDVLRAINFAVREGAKVLNMSFSFAAPSQELSHALQRAVSRGLVPVASVGNDGQERLVYPAALPDVIGVASTTDYDSLSTFSNFGPEVAWIAAPGEAVITTYPMGTWAAAWGTSFSTPFASGTAALLAEVDRQVSAGAAADAQGYSIWISPEVSRGRLDVPSALEAYLTRLGLH